MMLRSRIPLALVASAVLTALSLGASVYVAASKRLRDAAENKLVALADAREASVRAYLEGLESDIILTANNRSLKDAVVALTNGWRIESERSGDAGTALRTRYIVENPFPASRRDRYTIVYKGSMYDTAHARIQGWVTDLAKRRGLADVLLVSPDNAVIYSAAKGSDFGSQVQSGPLVGVMDRFRDTIRPEQVQVIDFTAYGPDATAPSAFIASPVIQALPDGQNQLLAALVFRLRPDGLDRIMQASEGMGATGSTVLVGRDGLLRSTPRFSSQPAVLQHYQGSATDAVTGAYVEAGLLEAANAQGNQVLLAIRQLDFHDLHWQVLAEAAVGEVLAPVNAMRNEMVLIGSALVLLLSIGGVLFARSITRPVTALSQAMQRLADGNRAIDVPALGRRDEIGAMAQAMEVFKEALIRADALHAEQERMRAAREINAHKKAEEADRIRALILENIGHGVHYVDGNGIIRFTNSAMDKMYGYEPGELVGKHESILNDLPAEQSRQLVSEIMETVASRLEWSGEVKCRRKTGGGFISWAKVTLALISGQPYAVSIQTDITEYRRMLDETRQAKERAEAADLAKSRFLATMSHEIRTPITSVLGMADLLRRTELSEEQAGYVGTMASATQTLLTILNDILDISKIEAGKITIEMAEFNLWEAARDVVEFGRGTASAKGLMVDLEIAGDVPTAVIGDQARLKQVLYNLISNAIKFTESGNIHLGLSVDRRDGSSVVLRCAVEDTGIGISPEQVERLFKPFSQLDASTTRRFGGTGLGLAITKRLLELMEGQIAVESEPGQGARFWFTLPLKIGSGAASALRQVPRRLAAPGKPTRSLRILLAEDNRINQMLVRSMLQKFGHRVEVVDNGRWAVAAVEAGDFDVVLMDMQMPEMDGEEATRAIRSLAGPKSAVPIVALTADVMPEHKERYFTAGINEFVAKPIDWNTLSSALEAHTRGHNGHVPANDLRAETPFEGSGLPVSLPGIDLQQALLRVEGQQDLFRLLLGQFVQDNYATADELAGALAAGDLPAVGRLSHTLRGSAGNLGALGVVEAAGALEAAIRNRETETLPAGVERIRQCLEEVFQGARLMTGTNG